MKNELIFQMNFYGAFAPNPNYFSLLTQRKVAKERVLPHIGDGYLNP
jgi:hypothetical protein